MRMIETMRGYWAEIKPHKHEKKMAWTTKKNVFLFFEGAGLSVLNTLLKIVSVFPKNCEPGQNSRINLESINILFIEEPEVENTFQ